MIASAYIRQLRSGLPLCCMHGRSRRQDGTHLWHGRLAGPDLRIPITVTRPTRPTHSKERRNWRYLTSLLALWTSQYCAYGSVHRIDIREVQEFLGGLTWYVRQSTVWQLRSNREASDFVNVGSTPLAKIRAWRDGPLPELRRSSLGVCPGSLWEVKRTIIAHRCRQERASCSRLVPMPLPM